MLEDLRCLIEGVAAMLAPIQVVENWSSIIQTPKRTAEILREYQQMGSAGQATKKVLDYDKLHTATAKGGLDCELGTYFIDLINASSRGVRK